MINTSVHIGMLIIGSIMVTAGVFYGGMTTGSLLFCLLPGILIALAKIAGAGIGGADIWAVFVSGIVSGPAETFKAFLVGLALFTAIKRKGKGAFLPYYLFGYIGALFI